MDVAICRNGVDVLPVRSLNISCNGIFIQIEPSSLPRSAMVEVVFLRGSRSNSVITPRRAFAMIVRFANRVLG
jgi:hypothetical protein